MAKTVLVIGATGNVGTATVSALSSRGIVTRAGARDPSSDKAKALATQPHVESVRADLGDPDSLPPALAGVSAVFIVTPGAENRAELVAAGVATAKTAGVSHIVVVSVPSVLADGDLIFKQQFNAIEADLKSSGVPATVLRLPMFLENQWGNVESIKGQSKIYSPVDPAKPAGLVAVADVAAAAAAILADGPAKHGNQVYTLVSDVTSFGEVAEHFAAATGKPVEHVRVPYEAAVEAMVGMGMPLWQSNGVAELLRLVDDSSPAAVGETEQLAALLGRKPTTAKAWIGQVADAFKA